MNVHASSTYASPSLAELEAELSSKRAQLRQVEGRYADLRSSQEAYDAARVCTNLATKFLLCDIGNLFADIEEQGSRVGN